MGRIHKDEGIGRKQEYEGKGITSLVKDQNLRYSLFPYS